MPASSPSTHSDLRRFGGTLLVGPRAGPRRLGNPAAARQGSVALAAPCCSFSDTVLNTLLFIPLGAGLVLLGLRPRAAMLIATVVSVWHRVGAVLVDRRTIRLDRRCGGQCGGCPARRADGGPLAPARSLVAESGTSCGGDGGARVALRGAGGAAGRARPGRMGGGVGARRRWAPAVRGHTRRREPPGDPAFPRSRGESIRPARPCSPRRTRPPSALTIVTGPPSTEAQQLLEITVGEGNAPFLILRQEGQALRAYQRLELFWVGLSSPWIAVSDALPATAGDTVRITLTGTGRHLRLAVTRDDVRRESSLTLSPDLYLSALFYRATDGTAWWVLVPSMLSFVLLGLALANRPKLSGGRRPDGALPERQPGRVFLSGVAGAGGGAVRGVGRGEGRAVDGSVRQRLVV